MKQALICKGFSTDDITDEDLTLINRYTRRELEKGEIYVFPLVLCDNEIDRDGEKFSVEALCRLRRLFAGKTGVFDHDARGENQVARIFSTKVESDELRYTADGEKYQYLTAKAYMVRSEKTRDLILEIDAGIKKEVSVGCAVESVTCSICGADVRRAPCAHRLGTEYDGKNCYRILNGPTDAYEWSFVAVPAQPAAGVTKAFLAEAASTGGARGLSELEKALECGATAVTGPESAVLVRELRALRAGAKAGEEYREGLVCDVLRRAALSGSGMDREVLHSIARGLETNELRELAKAFAGPRPAPAQLADNVRRKAGWDALETGGAKNLEAIGASEFII